jgi:hypothetical protein
MEKYNQKIKEPEHNSSRESYVTDVFWLRQSREQEINVTSGSTEYDNNECHKDEYYSSSWRMG